MPQIDVRSGPMRMVEIRIGAGGRADVWTAEGTEERIPRVVSLHEKRTVTGNPIAQLFTRSEDDLHLITEDVFVTAVRWAQIPEANDPTEDQRTTLEWDTDRAGNIIITRRRR